MKININDINLDDQIKKEENATIKEEDIKTEKTN